MTTTLTLREVDTRAQDKDFDLIAEITGQPTERLNG